MKKRAEEPMNRWKKNSLLLLGFGLIGLAVLASALPAAKKPKIVVDRETWDFGQVKQGETLNHEFVFRNAGEAVLNIGNVETSCGCTAALVSEKKLEPGKQGRVKVSFSTAGYGGQVSKYIYLDSDDPDRPRVQLTISADVATPPRPRLELQPWTADVGLILQNEPIEAEVIIRNKGDLELTVGCDYKAASFSSGGKPFSFPLKLAAGKEKAVKIKLTLPDRVGVLFESLLFKTNDPAYPSASFPLRGYIITAEQVKELLARHKDKF
jgi:hypothetical protein